MIHCTFSNVIQEPAADPQRFKAQTNEPWYDGGRGNPKSAIDAARTWFDRAKREVVLLPDGSVSSGYHSFNCDSVCACTITYYEHQILRQNCVLRLSKILALGSGLS